MSIQKLSAKDNNIKLYACLENIDEKDSGFNNDLIQK